VAKVLHRPFLRRRRDGERGAVLVEAALIFPLLIFIVLAIAEYSLASRNSLTVSSSTRAGARTASALARNANFDDDAVTAVATALTAMPKARWQEIWVYKAQDPNDPASTAPGMPDSGDFTTCGTCVRYAWNGTIWLETQNTWPEASQDACPGEGEYIGIYVKAEHKYVTKLFGSSRTLQDHTVMRFEPLSSASTCKP
jgi:hypothetical protein